MNCLEVNKLQNEKLNKCDHKKLIYMGKVKNGKHLNWCEECKEYVIGGELIG